MTRRAARARAGLLTSHSKLLTTGANFGARVLATRLDKQSTQALDASTRLVVEHAVKRTRGFKPRAGGL